MDLKLNSLNLDSFLQNVGPPLQITFILVLLVHRPTLIMVFKFELIKFLFKSEINNSFHCQDLNPRPPQWQAAMLTISCHLTFEWHTFDVL